MAKAKLFITHPLYPDTRSLLQTHCECEFWTKPERPMREEFLSRLKDKEGLVCLLTERVDGDALRAAPNLVFLAIVAVCFNKVDVPASPRRGVIVTNPPGVPDAPPFGESR